MNNFFSLQKLEINDDKLTCHTKNQVIDTGSMKTYICNLVLSDAFVE
jgi:hypothetical protein